MVSMSAGMQEIRGPCPGCGATEFLCAYSFVYIIQHKLYMFWVVFMDKQLIIQFIFFHCLRYLFKLPVLKMPM